MLLVAGAAMAGEQSLAEAARRARQQREKEGQKAVKVYSNDNLPPPAPWETPTPSPVVAKATAESEAGAESKSKEAAPAASEPETEKSGDKKKTKDYWQEKFHATRSELASAESAQRLAQDELSLLQIQQAREIDPDVQSQVATKITAKQAELVELQTRVDKARQAFDDLQKAFEASEAPAEWSQPEPPPKDNETPSQ